MRSSALVPRSPAVAYFQGMVDDITALIVDDEPSIRDLTRLLLETDGEGLRVVGEAGDGASAVDAVRRLQPHVVILDMLMPGMDGFETATAILEVSPDQRIILFSAAITAGQEQQAMSLGVRACVDKLDVTAIPEIVRRVAAA